MIVMVMDNKSETAYVILISRIGDVYTLDANHEILPHITGILFFIVFFYFIFFYCKFQHQPNEHHPEQREKKNAN